MNEEILTVKEIAEYLKLNPITIYRWANRGEIPCFKIGDEWRFRREMIMRWIEAHENGNGGEKNHADKVLLVKGGVK